VLIRVQKFYHPTANGQPVNTNYKTCNMKKSTLLTLMFFLCLTITYSQPGQLDASFGNKGIVNTDFGTPSQIYSASATQVLTQADGTIYVIIATNGITITRLHGDGTMDSSYGRNGYAQSVFFESASGVLQPDGKIVLAGGTSVDFALARYNTDGTFDTTFSSDGKLTTDFASGYDYANSVAIQRDGKIVVAGGGFGDFAIARYNTDGTLDTTFSKDGKQTTDFASGDEIASSVALQSNGKIVVAGYTIGANSGYNYDFALARYNADGTPDTTFSGDGKQTTDFRSQNDFVETAAIQSDGKIVVSGGTSDDFALARYNTDGSLDTTFSEDGKQTTDFNPAANYLYDYAYSMIIQKDGKIILAGSDVVDFALARYNTDGSLDITFSEDGKQTTDFGYAGEHAASVALQTDGEIVVVGGSLTTDGDSGDDDKYNFSIARYNSDGSPDTAFSEDGKISDYIHAGHTIYTSSAIQSDGKIVVAGSTKQGSSSLFAVARYNKDGTLDTTFSKDGKKTTGFGSSGEVASSLVIQSDGKIVVAGYTNAENEYAHDFAVARYNTDGTLDTTFSEDGRKTMDFRNDIAFAVAVQNNGKIVVAGTVIARFNTDGSLDNTFSGDGIAEANFKISSVVLQNNGKIVVAGGPYYWELDSKSNLALARYNADGSLDNTFSEDGMQATDFEIASAAIQSDGKITVAGTIFNKANNTNDFALARYNTDGTPDITFSEDGKRIIDLASGHDRASSIVIQNDGKIVVAGNSWNGSNNNFALARFNTNGSLDHSFAEDGKQVTAVSEGSNIINDLAIFGNKLYAVGWGQYIGNEGVVAKYLLNSRSENKAPIVSLSIPYNILKYSATARIILNAAATDEDGTITKVQFYDGYTLLRTEDVYPYGFLWADVPAGNYTLTAKAFDNYGNVTTSNSIKVSVVDENVPPVVSIVSPVDDTTYTGPATIRLIANALDPNDKISKVEFYNGATLIRTEYYDPYTYKWTNVQPGTYTVTAKAYDDKGLSATSAPVTVTVTMPNLPIVNSRPSFEKQNDLSGDLSLRLSPNPARSSLQIYTKGLQQNKPSTISVISASGVVVKTINSSTLKQTVQLDVSSLVRGVYTVKVISGDKVTYKQFVKL